MQGQAIGCVGLASSQRLKAEPGLSPVPGFGLALRFCDQGLASTPGRPSGTQVKEATDCVFLRQPLRLWFDVREHGRRIRLRESLGVIHYELHRGLLRSQLLKVLFLYLENQLDPLRSQIVIL